LSSVAEIY